jgi:hypothetical protein
VANCPKCGTTQGTDDVACKKCGLAAERFDSVAQARDANVPDALIAAWDRAVEQWDEQARHDELIRLVTQHDAYAWAAARYRTKPDPIGERQLERIRKAAEVTMTSAAVVRQANAKKPYRGTTVVLVLLAVALFAGLAMAMVARNRAANGANPASVPGN